METSLSSCGHTYTDSGTGSERKERTEKFVKVNFPFMCNGRLFTHDFDHVLVVGVVWCNPLIFFNPLV